MSAAIGRPLIGWQYRVLDVALELLPDGTPAYQRVVVTVPRQSGKSALVDAVLLADLTVPGRRSWYTAQSGKAAQDRFREDFAPAVRRSPLSRGTKLRYANGSESAVTVLGSQVQIFPPRESAIHGKQVDRACIDEAWVFDIAQGRMLEQAIIPAGRTRPDFSMWLTSTAGTPRSAWLAENVAAGRDAATAGRTSGLAYFEWSAEGVDPDDIDAIIAAHPARELGSDRFIRDQWATMNRAEFLRSFGNVWSATADQIIPEQLWADTAGRVEPPAAGSVLAVDASRDGARASIGAAWATEGGRVAVALVDARPGTGWLAAELPRIATQHRPAAIVYDVASPAGHAIDEAARACRPGPVPLQWADVTKACALFLSRLRDRRIVHTPDPDLDAAAGNAAQRFAGDRWAWGRRVSAGPIDPLLTVTLAAYRVVLPDGITGKPRVFAG